MSQRIEASMLNLPQRLWYEHIQMSQKRHSFEKLRLCARWKRALCQVWSQSNKWNLLWEPIEYGKATWHEGRPGKESMLKQFHCWVLKVLQSDQKVLQTYDRDRGRDLLTLWRTSQGEVFKQLNIDSLPGQPSCQVALSIQVAHWYIVLYS